VSTEMAVHFQNSQKMCKKTVDNFHVHVDWFVQKMPITKGLLIS